VFYIKIDKSSLTNPNSKKDIMLTWYLYATECRNGYIYLDINNLVKYYGYSPSTKENGINTIFKSSLHKMITNNSISLINENSNNKQSIYTLKFIKENNIPVCINFKSNFVILEDSEINTILNYYLNNKSKTKSYIDNTIYLYLIIKKFMNFHEENIPYGYPSLENLHDYSKLSKQSILNTIAILKDMNLIYTYNLGTYITKNGIVKNYPLIYTLQPINEDLLKTYIDSMKTNLKE